MWVRGNRHRQNAGLHPINVCAAYLAGRIGGKPVLDFATAERCRKAHARFNDLAGRARFTADWFTPHIDTWVAALAPRLAHIKPDILEIGSWEGMSTLFMLSFFEDSTLTDVDTWEGGDDQRSLELGGRESRFDRNVAPVADRIRKIKGLSAEVLPRLHCDRLAYDLIYVDGSHCADDLPIDALNSQKMLGKGGRLIFDDCLWRQNISLSSNPANAVNLFLRQTPGQYRLIRVGAQVLIERLKGDADAPAAWRSVNRVARRQWLTTSTERSTRSRPAPSWIPPYDGEPAP